MSAAKHELKGTGFGGQHYTIAVSGSASGVCDECGYTKAYDVGKEIAKHNCVLLNGATTGVPHYSAIGAHEHGGFCIGFSPAISKKEHVKKYALPLDGLDFIIYTGFNYSGRNLLLTRAADAVVVVCGRIGTLNEFTSAFEDGKLIGVLLHSGGITDEIPHIIEVARRGRGRVVYSDDPAELIDKIVANLKEDDHINFKASGKQLHGDDINPKILKCVSQV